MEKLILSRTLDTPTDMKYFIAIITMLTIFSCKPNYRKQIEVVFSPGLVELNHTNLNIITSIKKVDKTYNITSDDYTFLQATLSSLGEITQTKEESPCILIKVDNNIYSIGVHNTFQNNNKTYSLSEEDAYRIKSIVHFYDYIDEDNLEKLREIKQFGLPHNYDYCPSNPQKPTKQFIKLMLIEEK